MRVFLLLLLCEALFCAYPRFQDIFPLKRYILIENLDGIDMVDVDVPIRIDTAALIAEEKLVDCSYLRFQAEGSFVNFFVETSCDTDNTLIWLNLPRVNATGMNVTMYYDVSDFERIESTGAEIEWDSDFLVLTDGSCGAWDDFSVDRFRFLQISDTYQEGVDGNDQISNHRHNVFGDTGFADIFDFCYTGCVVDYGFTARFMHNHSFDFMTTYEEGLPPYQSIKMCENRYLDLEVDFVLAYNGSDSDFPFAGADEYDVFDGKFVVIYGDNTETGGVDSHDHEILGEQFTDLIQGYVFFSGVSIDDNHWSPQQHYHEDVDMIFTSISNIPTSFEIPFAILTEDDETDFHPYLFFAKSLPPIGYHQSSLTGRYIQGGSSFGGLYESNTDDHELDSSTIGLSGEWRKRCAISGVGEVCAKTDHTHEFDEDLYTFEVEGDENWDPDEKDRVEVLGVFRKDVRTSAAVGGEIINLQCFGKDFNNPLACTGHGICEATNLCLCNTTSPVYYFGEECEIWSCNELANENNDVCNGKGDCIDYNTCDCDYNYNGTWCQWTCGGIEYNDYDRMDEICSGHGICVDIEKCNCTEGNYSGNICQDWYCFEYKNSDEGLVCSGKGDCDDYNYCNCYRGFVGMICQGKLGDAYFSDDGSELTLEYISDVKYFSSNEIPYDRKIKKYFPCSSKVENHEILGVKPFCYFTLNEYLNKTADLTILLGKNPTITGESGLYILDSGGKSNRVSVILPVHPSLPSIGLRDDLWYCVSNETFLETCDGNLRDLQFFWTVSLYPDGDLYMESTEKYFRIEEYGDMQRNAEYVVYLQAMNFLGGYDVDFKICYVPPELLEKSSVFEKGSTYGYFTFYGFSVGGTLVLCLACFVGCFCFCWNALQLDVVQDRLFGIQLLAEDIGVARKKQKLREYRMTMMEVSDGMDEDEWDEYESELKDFARRSVNMSPLTPSTPSSATGFLEGRGKLSDAPSTPISSKNLRKEYDDDFKVIKDVKVDKKKKMKMKEEEDDLSNAKTFKRERFKTPVKSKPETPLKVKDITPERVKEKSLSELVVKSPTTPKRMLPPRTPPPKGKLPFPSGGRTLPKAKRPPKGKLPFRSGGRTLPKAKPPKGPPLPPPKVPPPKGKPALPTRGGGKPLPNKKEEKKKRNLFESDSESDSDEERKGHHTFQSFVNQFNEED